MLQAVNKLIAELEEQFQNALKHPDDSASVDIMRKALKYLHKKQVELQGQTK